MDAGGSFNRKLTWDFVEGLERGESESWRLNLL